MMQLAAFWISIGAFQGSWMYWNEKLASSGTYLRMYSPEGSKRLPNRTGSMHCEQSSMRSKAELEIHIQLPALMHQSLSIRFSIRCLKPCSQLSHKSPRVRNTATAFRIRWWAQPPIEIKQWGSFQSFQSKSFRFDGITSMSNVYPIEITLLNVISIATTRFLIPNATYPTGNLQWTLLESLFVEMLNNGNGNKPSCNIWRNPASMKG